MAIQNVKIRPMYAYLGSDVMQEQKITCRADTAADTLGGKYFLFHDSAGAKRYAWFDTGSSVDPAPAGTWTGHTVVISALATADAVATALAAVLTAITGFDAAASGAIVTLTHTVAGYAMPAREGLGTKFNFMVETLGSVEVNVGCIDGDIEISGLQPEKENITCHASGTTVKGQLVKGYPLMEATMSFKETDKETLKKSFIAAGHYSFMPVGAGATEMFGYGVVNVGNQVPTQKLRLHPVDKSSGDLSEDWTFWKAEAMLDTFTFSGENISTIPLTFSIFPDESKNKEIQFFAVGNSSQAGI